MTGVCSGAMNSSKKIALKNELFLLLHISDSKNETVTPTNLLPSFGWMQVIHNH